MEEVLIQEILRLREKNMGVARKSLRAVKRVLRPFYRAVFKKNEVINTPDISANHKRIKPQRGRIDIINANFYDWDGKTVFKGGAERYVFDLANLLKEMGYKPRILQGANFDFQREYRGIKVLGVKCPHNNLWWLSRVFPKVCEGAELVISSPFELAAIIDTAPCIGISHSVKFDTPAAKNLTKLPDDLVNPYALTFEAIRNLKTCVCNDTNFINWMRTRDHELSKKLCFIPNYYDEKVFHPTKKVSKDKIVFIFPRRIEESRGHRLTIEAFSKVVKKHPEAILRIIGQFQDETARHDVEEAIAMFPNNISHTQYTMEESYKAYRDADVMLAPTVYMEGTSLSCIEAMASGIPVIATTVGGLPNLIIDHYNGFLIPTTAEDLAKAMTELIEDGELRKDMSRRALDVATSSFTKELWKKRWQKIITEVMGENAQR